MQPLKGIKQTYTPPPHCKRLNKKKRILRSNRTKEEEKKWAERVGENAVAKKYTNVDLIQCEGASDSETIVSQLLVQFYNMQRTKEQKKFHSFDGKFIVLQLNIIHLPSTIYYCANLLCMPRIEIAYTFRGKRMREEKKHVSTENTQSQGNTQIYSSLSLCVRAFKGKSQYLRVR